MSSDQLEALISEMGTGPRSSEDLTYTRARRLMQGLLDPDVHPVTFGAVLVALRWKGETVHELAGFLDELRSRITPLPIDRGRVLDVAGRFDGKQKSIHTDLPASLLAVACGQPIFTHGGQNVPTKPGGVTFLDVIESLQWNPSPTVEQTRRAMETTGFGYLHQATYLPDLERIRGWRSRLGLRSVFNTVESMLNPIGAPVHLGSFYHLPFARRVGEAFEGSQSLHMESVFMLQGVEGQPEARPGPCLLTKWQDHTLDDQTFRSDKLGLSIERSQLEAIGASAATSARLLRNLFEGNETPRVYRNQVLLNTAVRLRAGGKENTLQDGIERAWDVLKSPAPRKLMNQLERVYGRESDAISNSI